jgi:membrane-bound lytic murein transglycosylase MltF
MKKLLAIAALLYLASTMACSGVARAGSCASDTRILQRLEVESILADVALIHSLDPGLLSAIAQVESDECSDAVSPKGAAGLMQLMPGTASEFGVADRFDPVQNALGAARFIDYLKRNRPEGNLSLPEILAAYNAGEAAVMRAGGIPHYRETEEYVRRVLWVYLLGHVPQSQRTRDTASYASHQSKPHAPAVKASRRYADNDSSILDQMAQLRRSREPDGSRSADTK